MFLRRFFGDESAAPNHMGRHGDGTPTSSLGLSPSSSSSGGDSEYHGDAATSGCPFHGGNKVVADDDYLTSFLANKKRVILLYEEYVKLPKLKEVRVHAVIQRSAPSL